MKMKNYEEKLHMINSLREKNNFEKTQRREKIYKGKEDIYSRNHMLRDNTKDLENYLND